MIDQRIRLRHLRAFVEVARRRSVTGAALALHVSQPAVTRTIRELEEALGVSLFQRDGRGIILTRQGEIFLRHAGTAVESLRRGVDSLVRGEAAGPPIRVGALPTASARIMPEAIRICLEEGRVPSVKIVTGENSVLLDQLRLGELDLVVGRLAAPEKMTGFFFEHLYSERVVFVVRAGHPLLGTGADVFARLAEFPVLMPTRGSIIRPFVERFLITNAAPVGPGEIETVSDSFGRAFTRACDAVWAISEGVVAQDLADGALIELPFDTSETRGPVGLTMRTDGLAAPGFEPLLVAIRRAADAMRPPAGRGGA